MTDQHSADNEFRALKTPLTYAAWRHIPSTYLHCENDQAMKLPLQEKMVAATAGVVQTERCSAGHSSYLSQPDVIVALVQKLSGEDGLDMTSQTTR